MVKLDLTPRFAASALSLLCLLRRVNSDILMHRSDLVTGCSSILFKALYYYGDTLSVDMTLWKWFLDFLSAYAFNVPFLVAQVCDSQCLKRSIMLYDQRMPRCLHFTTVHWYILNYQVILIVGGQSWSDCAYSHSSLGLCNMFID